MTTPDAKPRSLLLRWLFGYPLPTGTFQRVLCPSIRVHDWRYAAARRYCGACFKFEDREDW